MYFKKSPLKKSRHMLSIRWGPWLYKQRLFCMCLITKILSTYKALLTHLAQWHFKKSFHTYKLIYKEISYFYQLFLTPKISSISFFKMSKILSFKTNKTQMHRTMRLISKKNALIFKPFCSKWKMEILLKMSKNPMLQNEGRFFRMLRTLRIFLSYPFQIKRPPKIQLNNSAFYYKYNDIGTE